MTAATATCSEPRPCGTEVRLAATTSATADRAAGDRGGALPAGAPGHARDGELADAGLDRGMRGRAQSEPIDVAGAASRAALVVVDDAAVAHVHDGARRRGDAGVVGHEQDRLAAGVEAAEQLDDLLAAGGVERAGGLVGQEQRGLVRERAGDREALALAAGEHAGHRRRLVADAQQVEEVAGPRLGGLAAPSRDDRGERHVLEHRHPLEQVEELEHDADVPAPHPRELVLAAARDELARDGDRALVGHVEPRDEVEQRRLAAARRAHQRHELPGGRR